MIKDFYKTLDFNDFKYSQEFFDLKISKKNYYLTFAISVFIFSFFLWAFLFDVDIVAKGFVTIRPKEEISIVKIKNSGIVIDKKYKNGQIVNEGDILIHFNTSLLKYELENKKEELKKNENELT
ncbi:MAG: hypothetical protein HUJ68_11555, partial [Clostridia bacterium]|nr:hypothetical protein [Clostridia bacterium]